MGAVEVVCINVSCFYWKKAASMGRPSLQSSRRTGGEHGLELCRLQPRFLKYLARVLAQPRRQLHRRGLDFHANGAAYEPIGLSGLVLHVDEQPYTGQMRIRLQIIQSVDA